LDIFAKVTNKQEQALQEKIHLCDVDRRHRKASKHSRKHPLISVNNHIYNNIIATAPVLTNSVGNTSYYALKRQFLCLPGKDPPAPSSKKVRASPNTLCKASRHRKSRQGKCSRLRTNLQTARTKYVLIYLGVCYVHMKGTSSRLVRGIRRRVVLSSQQLERESQADMVA